MKGLLRPGHLRTATVEPAGPERSRTVRGGRCLPLSMCAGGPLEQPGDLGGTCAPQGVGVPRVQPPTPGSLWALARLDSCSLILFSPPASLGGQKLGQHWAQWVHMGHVELGRRGQHWVGIQAASRDRTWRWQSGQGRYSWRRRAAGVWEARGRPEGYSYLTCSGG